MLITITYTDDIQVDTSFICGFRQADTSFTWLKNEQVRQANFLLCQRSFYITAKYQ